MSAPNHVPPHLIREFDYMAAAHGKPAAGWKELLGDAPDIFWTPLNGGHWVFTRHADMDAILSTPADFSSRTQAIPKTEKPFLLPPLEYDPPQHTDYRRLLAPFFAPKAMAELERRAHTLTTSLIDGFIERGECEFISEYALVMPIGIFMGLVDLPDSDRLYLIGCADAMTRGTPEKKTAGFERAFAYLATKFVERRANPGTDIFSTIIKAELESGRPLTDMELLGMGALLFGAGLDTVAAMMGFIMIHLATHEEDRMRLVNEPKLISSALEELMRRYQIANLAREVTRDLTFRDISLREGDKVLTPTSMAGLDESQYPDPETVDFARVKKRSLVFGGGPHQCLGQFLARTELRVFLTEWLRRIPHFQIKPGTAPKPVGGPANTVESLTLIWSKSAA